MTTRPEPKRRAPQLMVQAFPTPGPRVQLAYRELYQAFHGSDDQKKALGNPALLPRPWEPGSCLEPELREQLWLWFEDVVIWLNREYTWDVGAQIPSCWPEHPHLVHEIATVADARRRAALAPNGNDLEDWHRYCLPAFIDRMRGRLKQHCEDGHGRWPGRSRHSEHTSARDTELREEAYAADLDAMPSRRRATTQPPAGPRLAAVDLSTGELRGDIDPHDHDHDR